MKTKTAVDAAPVGSRSGELYHLVCCRDDDAALCGYDVAHLSWSDGSTEQHCVVCASFDGCAVCPLDGGSCPEIEGD